MICPRCKGQRIIIKADIMKATTVREQCPDCKGLGEVQGDISDGLKVKPEPGQITYFSLFKGGKPRAVKKFGQHTVKFVITSWYDSTDAGKEFLLKRGFVREKNILIWRRDAKPKAGEGTGTVPKVQSTGSAEEGGGDQGNDKEAGDGRGDSGNIPDNKD